MSQTLPTLLVSFAVLQTALYIGLIRLADLYEREPVSLIIVLMGWGATGGYILAVTGNSTVADAFPSQAWISPAIEEAAKAVALIAAFVVARLLSRRLNTLEFEGATDGIVYGAAVGLGFAFAEDLGYLFGGLLMPLETPEGNTVNLAVRTYLNRVGFGTFSPLSHGAYTATFGAFLGMATWHKRRIVGTLSIVAGLILAIAMHWFHNYLFFSSIPSRILNLVDIGFAVVASLLMFLWLRHQKRVISMELAGEGRVDSNELRLLASYIERSNWYYQLFRERGPAAVALMRARHTELVDLAFLKRLARRGVCDPSLVREKSQRIELLFDIRD